MRDASAVSRGVPPRPTGIAGRDSPETVYAAARLPGSCIPRSVSMPPNHRSSRARRSSSRSGQHRRGGDREARAGAHSRASSSSPPRPVSSSWAYSRMMARASRYEPDANTRVCISMARSLIPACFSARDTRATTAKMFPSSPTSLAAGRPFALLGSRCLVVADAMLCLGAEVGCANQVKTAISQSLRDYSAAMLSPQKRRKVPGGLGPA